MARPAPLPPESAPGRHRVCHVKELRIIFMLTRLGQLINLTSGQGQVVIQVGLAAHWETFLDVTKYIGTIFTYLSSLCR